MTDLGFELILTQHSSQLVEEATFSGLRWNVKLKTTATPPWLVDRVFTDSAKAHLVF